MLTEQIGEAYPLPFPATMAFREVDILEPARQIIEPTADLGIFVGMNEAAGVRVPTNRVHHVIIGTAGLATATGVLIHRYPTNAHYHGGARGRLTGQVEADQTAEPESIITEPSEEEVFVAHFGLEPKQRKACILRLARLLASSAARDGYYTTTYLLIAENRGRRTAQAETTFWRNSLGAALGTDPKARVMIYSEAHLETMSGASIFADLRPGKLVEISVGIMLTGDLVDAQK